VLKYITRKILLTLPLIVGIVTLIFILLEVAPGSVVDRFINQDTTPEVEAALIEKWNLNDPVFFRYLAMVKNLVVLDFGQSMSKGDTPVFDLIAEALPNTIILGFVTLLFLFPTGILLGTIQAVRQNQVIDTSISVVSLFFYSMPGFWLAMMLQLVFAYHMSNWLGIDIVPIDGMNSTIAFTYPEWSLSNPIAGKRTLDVLWHLILPGAALGMAFSAGTARYMRSSLLEVIRQDYIRTARAKGVPEFWITFKHAMRNALLPIVTLLGLSVRGLVGGTVLVEMIFSWPGMGRLIVDAIFAQDAPLIIGCCFILTIMTVGGNLLADILYGVIDPRIRYQ
jgi:peptide/nickel transport system permease protein